MDFITALDMGASALSAERTHINIISMNLANVKTTRTANGGPYRRRSVVLESTPLDADFKAQMRGALDKELRGVRVQAIPVDQRPHKMVYEPGHPDADPDGYVAYPDINVVEEMAALMTAQRGYEANVTSVDTIKQMYTKALEINR
ncbi:MAG: flagellar basal body rod protein FlgC [Desulfovibrio sp.]|jgi:flagellar basal-body rod protein FlgC|nr:flagellar basal body rod protein FlgC [Desulfovibrio sp.]